MRKLIVFLVLLLGFAAAGLAEPVGPETARAAAGSRLVLDGMDAARRLGSPVPVLGDDAGVILAWTFELDPSGYVVTTADDLLPPVIAYSYSGALELPGEAENPLLELVRLDLGARIPLLGRLPDAVADLNRSLWAAASSGGSIRPSGRAFEQWPPAGSTPTEGWLMENWTQSAPYNAFCPMDLIAGQRSVAGCPAVAMAMIVNLHETTNGTRFTDADDYYHNYHEYYWIDDDHVAHDFPSWPELNVLLDTLDVRYANQEALSDDDKAALVYACGAACRQVYTASVSGTFGVDQAYDAYVRFAFSDSELLFATSDSLYERMAANMMTARPAHLAIIDEGPQYGHNVVVDGYNTDGFFHLNFGWGGPYNAWYQFPLSGMPYGMNFIEGIVLDIGEASQSAEGGAPTPGGGHPVTLGCASNPTVGGALFLLGLEEDARITLSVYSLAGRLVSTPAEGDFPRGSHEVRWDPRGAAAGVYIVRAAHPDGIETVVFTLLE